MLRHHATASAAKPAITESGMSVLKLLAVDDEPFNLEIISEYFEGSGMRVDAADGGDEAMRLLASGERYGAIILDRMMPPPDGLTVLKAIKADGRLRNIPVIMQTAAGSPDQVREGLAAGAHYYLVKPYERDSLLSIVRGALADTELRMELARRLAETSAAMRMLTAGSFEVRTLADVSALSGLLAGVCSQPEAAALALSELLVNAVEHGNLGISYADKSELRRTDRWDAEVARREALTENRAKKVTVDFSRSDAGVRFRIADEGGGFDWKTYLEFDPDRAFDPNGRGIALARMTAGVGIEYVGSGNIVVLTMQQ